MIRPETINTKCIGIETSKFAYLLVLNKFSAKIKVQLKLYKATIQEKRKPIIENAKNACIIDDLLVSLLLQIISLPIAPPIIAMMPHKAPNKLSMPYD